MSKVLILGASGKIGARAADAFQQAGWSVVRYRRGTDMTAAAMGCDVIVNGLNPPNYHNWAQILPEITAQVIAAARASGATVILPGNVYNFGDRGGVWDETTPQRPFSRKGRLRVEMEAQYRASGVRTIVLRAGNFIDPERKDDVMGVVLMRGITRGKLTSPGDPGAMQAFCYLPDWARAAVMLAERRGDLACFEDVPFAGHSFTVEALREAVSRATGREIRIAGFPWLALRLLGPVWEMAREVVEMRYLWSVPHRLSGEKLARLLPEFRASDAETVMLAGLPDQVRPDQAMGPGKQPVVTQ
ncbi:NAD-dependent epimerase/dehydratase family protein [Roseisalinus antarcticus]|uniref:NAD-dependent epimerase/dehydratase domain-containing protein n=1 Tax=Roseisalinus antarcticus TaxID=254357 RepID=A0A1Y5T9Q6_9RHOB|nr:NAD-dependent epimerase/dehydratase family protein [Roseisalinus antarcticus]SLN58753.1 hypothetical protein ROA7023_02705 [Roseisalinus antarcticus]